MTALYLVEFYAAGAPHGQRHYRRFTDHARAVAFLDAMRKADHHGVIFRALPVTAVATPDELELAG